MEDYMNNTEFIIQPANQEQSAYILNLVNIFDGQKRENATIFVAEDGKKEVVGRIVATERDVPSPLSGRYWFIDNLFVVPEERRKGVATALVNKIKEEAEKADVLYLHGSAAPSVEASLFWMKQNFTMNAYGKRQDDPKNPKYYGNFFHMFSYRLNRNSVLDDVYGENIRKASGDEILRWIEEKPTDEKKKAYFLSKANELIGFAACNENNEINGVVVGLPDAMQAPLESVRLWTDVFVEDPYRHKGIGKSLVAEMVRYAGKIGAIQLSHVDPTEDYIGFWYEIGFDILFWDVSRQTGRRRTTAMLRVR